VWSIQDQWLSLLRSLTAPRPPDMFAHFATPVMALLKLLLRVWSANR
jgi:hypothetical protein